MKPLVLLVAALALGALLLLSRSPEPDATDSSRLLPPAPQPSADEQTTPPPEAVRTAMSAPEPSSVGQEMLDQVAAIYGYEPRPSDAFFGPIETAERVAMEHAEILFGTPYEAITSSLSAPRAAEVIACLEQQNSDGDPLYAPITTPSVAWIPIGKYRSESWLLYDHFYEDKAKDVFLSALLRKYNVEAPFDVNRKNLRLSKHFNPKNKALSDEDWLVIKFALDEHYERIRDLILSNGLFEAQLAARQDLVEKGRYEHVPGIAFGTIESCDSRPKEVMSLRVYHVINGWAVYMIAMQGEYPELDRKLGELKAAVELRDSEVKAYIASF